MKPATLLHASICVVWVVTFGCGDDGSTPLDGGAVDRDVGVVADAGGDGAAGDLCEGTDCGTNGTCRVVGTEAVCACDFGYMPVGGSCTAGSGWWGVGDSDLGPHDVTVITGSASGNGVSQSPGIDDEAPSLAFDGNDDLFVAWDQEDVIRMARLVDGRLEPFGEELGDLLLSPGGGPQLAAGVGEMVLLAWRSPDDELDVRQWDGTSWTQLGDPTAMSIDSVPAVVLDGNSTPWVAFRGRGRDSIEVLRWDGSAWVGPASDGTGSLAVSGPDVATPRLAVDSQGRPTVAYTTPDANNRGRVQVRRWSATGWEAIGSSTATTGLSPGQFGVSSLDVAVDALDAPWVTFDQLISSGALSRQIDVYLTRFDGTTWVDLDGAAGRSTMSTIANGPELDIRGDAIMLSARRVPLGRASRCILWEITDPLASIAPSTPPGRNQNQCVVAVDGMGSAVMAWQELVAIGESEVYMARWIADELEELATPTGGLDEAPVVRNPHVELGEGSRPTVGWSAGDAVRMSTWAQTDEWLMLDGTAVPEVFGRHISFDFTMDASNSPAVVSALAPSSTETERTVARWRDSSWLLQPSSPQDSALRECIEVLPSGELVVVWHNEPQNTLFAGRVDEAGNFTGVGGELPTMVARAAGGRLLDFDLAVDASGNIYVAWSDDAAGSVEVYVTRFDGTSWAGLAGSDVQGISPLGEDSTVPRITAAGEHVIASWRELSGAIHVQRWDVMADSWEVVADETDGLGVAQPPSVHAIDVTPEGRVAVAWSETGDIYLKRWNGTVWDEVAGSATGRGISNSLLSAGAPAVALADSALCVAWMENLSGGNRFAVMRCTSE